ncbi:hypothetical protein DFP72DRAFT_1076688 [Ephemerocybe angulata]|uniref:Uncharacterized protein n=1 Tax=Ephemerocybe angulata TaxID=980116 RepID=A0A8H6HH06_9AGAR|nr:hypothetical protein DFP72DRAFT_1076688 [Tulosesus angulatus]
MSAVPESPEDDVSFAKMFTSLAQQAAAVVPAADSQEEEAVEVETQIVEEPVQEDIAADAPGGEPVQGEPVDTPLPTDEQPQEVPAQEGQTLRNGRIVSTQSPLKRKRSTVQHECPTTAMVDDVGGLREGVKTLEESVKEMSKTIVTLQQNGRERTRQIRELQAEAKAARTMRDTLKATLVKQVHPMLESVIASVSKVTATQTELLSADKYQAVLEKVSEMEQLLEDEDRGGKRRRIEDSDAAEPLFRMDAGLLELGESTHAVAAQLPSSAPRLPSTPVRAERPSSHSGSSSSHHRPPPAAPRSYAAEPPREPARPYAPGPAQGKTSRPLPQRPVVPILEVGPVAQLEGLPPAMDLASNWISKLPNGPNHLPKVTGAWKTDDWKYVRIAIRQKDDARYLAKLWNNPDAQGRPGPLLGYPIRVVFQEN